MEDQFSSIDSEAAAPLVFEVEQTDSTVPVRIRDESGRASRPHQKLSLSTYESLCNSGELTSGDHVPGETTGSENMNGIEPVVAAVVRAAGVDGVTPKTSTPLKTDTADTGQVSMGAGLSPLTRDGAPGANDGRNRRAGTVPTRRETSRIDPGTVKVPVVGYETLPQRTRFTVYKLHVNRGEWDNWFVFRRYTDFVMLQRKLKILYPTFHMPLPPQRWFRDNYEETFLDERKHGLQTFINTILRREEFCNCAPVQQFFCFSDPPGPYDSVEQGRAYCEALETANYQLKMTVREKDSEMDLLRDELGLYKKQVELLTRALREQKVSGATNSSSNISLMAEINQSQSSSHQNNTADSLLKGRSASCRTDQSNSSLLNGSNHCGAASGYKENRHENSAAGVKHRTVTKN